MKVIKECVCQQLTAINIQNRYEKNFTAKQNHLETPKAEAFRDNFFHLKFLTVPLIPIYFLQYLRSVM